MRTSLVSLSGTRAQQVLDRTSKGRTINQSSDFRKQLATATIGHLRRVSNTARIRREWMWRNSPSCTQPPGILRTYFGQEWDEAIQ